MSIRRRRTITNTTTTVDEYEASGDSSALAGMGLAGIQGSEEENATATDLDNLGGEESETGQQVVSDRASRPVVGHTWPDLVVNFKNDNRIVVVVLVALSTFIFAATGKIDSVSALKYPLIVGVALSAIWFGYPAVSSKLKALNKNR